MNRRKNRPIHKNTFYEKMQVSFFNSFEEEAWYVAKQRSETSYKKRLTDMEQLRKKVFHNQLLPDNSWKPVSRVFTIAPPYASDDSQ